MSGLANRGMAVGVPAVAGLAMLAAAVLLLPGPREIVQVERRAQPGASVAVPPPAVPLPVVPAIRPPVHPDIAAVIPTADAAQLAALTAALVADGATVTTLQVAYDLAAAGRGAVALNYLAARPDGASAATWPLRVDLLRKTGRPAGAVALLEQAVRAPGVAAPAIVAAGYALDRPDLLVAAAQTHAIPRPDGALSLDLARRLDAMGRIDLIATLDRVGSDWRRADPWTAIHVAQKQRDTAAALRAAMLLPEAERDAARETILTAAGDTAGLRAMLLAQAQTGGDLRTIAERLLAAGARDDAIAILARAAATGDPDTPAAQRLLYLMGPRPGARDLAWLRQRAATGPADEQVRWVAAYAERDRAADALAFVARHPLGDRTDLLLIRLKLADAARDDAGARAAMAMLLDGRTLTAAQVRTATAALPRRADPAQVAALARLRVADGIGDPRDRIDLAWTAWNGGDAARTIELLRPALVELPGDVAALRLMADAQARVGGDRAARPWLERALARTPTDGAARAELLDRLGRRAEALAMVETLRREAPRDRTLATLHARLLIAEGRPGAARMVLAR